jgi:hypothetical protein
MLSIEVTGDSLNDDADPLRLLIAAGSSGLLQIEQDGASRCIPIGTRASGWFSVNLPWENHAGSDAATLRTAWLEGDSWIGLQISLRGEIDEHPSTTIGSGWAVELPRFGYRFTSSVSGLDIGTRGGFVGTNHPEFRADVIRPPPSREGPGPRLAVTIPLSMPSKQVVSGTSEQDMTIILEGRDQIYSGRVWEIRRGWEGPYGPAIAAHASQDLAFSSDWTAFPGDLTALNDYVGWVQQTPNSPETVYHAQGVAISFNLQLASLSVSSVGGSA